MSHPSINIGSVETALNYSRESIGKVTLPREICMIYFAVMGNCKPPCDLNSFPRENLRLARRAACKKIQLLKLHVSYKDRKQACRELVLKYEAKSLK